MGFFYRNDAVEYAFFQYLIQVNWSLKKIIKLKEQQFKVLTLTKFSTDKFINLLMNIIEYPGTVPKVIKKYA